MPLKDTAGRSVHERGFRPMFKPCCFPLRPLSLALCLGLFCCSGWAQNADPTAADGATTSPLAALPPVHVENGSRLQGVRRVVLASFGVYVLHESDAAATSQGGSTRGTIASSSIALKTVGLETSRLQALTDQLHAQALEVLRAQGFDVIQLPESGGGPAVQAWREGGEASPLAFDAAAGKGWVLSARGLPLLHVSEMGWLHRNSGGVFGGPKVDDDFVSLGEKMGVGFRMVKLQPLLKNLSEAFGAPLLHIRLVLVPGSTSVQRSGFFAASADTRSSSGLIWPAFTNRLLLTTADGGVARVSLDKAQTSEQGIGELVDVTTGAETAGNIALAAFSILASASGHGRAVVNNSRKHELRVDVERFEAVVQAQTGLVLKALASRLAAPQAAPTPAAGGAAPAQAAVADPG